jgi:dienelactone hydrolase
MADIGLFHPLAGRVPGVVDVARRLEGLGHRVLAPDLFEGRIFTEDGASQAYLKEVGIKELMLRAGKALTDFPASSYYAGFSLGAVIAIRFAARKPGALGCAAIAGAVSLAEMGLESWPAPVPLQIHFADGDPGRNQSAIDSLGASARASGSSFSSFGYPGSGHLFCLPGHRDFDQASSDLLWERLPAFFA